MYTWNGSIDAVDNSSSVGPLNRTVTYLAHERAQVILYYGSGTTVAETISDGTNTYTRVLATVNDASDGQSAALFECLDTAAGTFTLAFTLASAQTARGIVVMHQSGLSNTIAAQAIGTNQLFFGNTTDHVSSGNITPASQPGMMMGIALDDGGGVATIVAGTGYTNEGTTTNIDAAFGTISRIEDKRLTSTSAVAATFTASGDGHFFAFGIFIPEASGAAAVGSRGKKNTIHPGRHPDRFGRHIRRKRNKTVVVSTDTGTLAVTLGDDTLAAQGATTVVGTLAVTLGGDTLAASGVVTQPVGSRRAKTPVHPGKGPYNLLKFRKSRRNTATIASVVTGSLAVTLGDDTLAAQGTTTVVGSLAKTLGNDTLAGQGTTTVVGSVGATLGNDTLAAQGKTTDSGTVAATLGNDTLAAQGTTTVKGSLAVTLGSDSLAAQGTTTIKGTLGTTLGNDTLSASGIVGIQTASTGSQHGLGIYIGIRLSILIGMIGVLHGSGRAF